LNLPNFISLGRLLLVPLIIWLISINQMSFAFYCFLIAVISDFLDGLAARIMKNTTVVGTYLDPIADKVLLIGVFITLGILNYFPIWLVLIVVFRDIMILGGGLLLVLSRGAFAVKPLMISKINTCIQMLFVTFVIAQAAFYQFLESINWFIMYLTAATTVISGIAYVLMWINQMNQFSDDQPV